MDATGLSAGLDGLEKPRASLERAMAMRATAERVDALQERLRAAARGAAASPTDDERSAASRTASLLHALLLADCAERTKADLQMACRLAAHATAQADGDGALLEAVAEAAAAAAKAARAVASAFTLLPPPEQSDADAGAVHEMASATDALLGRLRGLPSVMDAERCAALQELGRQSSALLHRQLDAAATLADAGQSTRGRRALSMLGEAGERLAASAAALVRAC